MKNPIWPRYDTTRIAQNKIMAYFSEDFGLRSRAIQRPFQAPWATSVVARGKMVNVFLPSWNKATVAYLGRSLLGPGFGGGSGSLARVTHPPAVPSGLRLPSCFKIFAMWNPQVEWL